MENKPKNKPQLTDENKPKNKLQLTDGDRRKRALKLIRLMKGDIITCMKTGAPLIVEGNGPLMALMTVIEVAEQATLKEMTPILGADGKIWKT